MAGFRRSRAQSSWRSLSLHTWSAPSDPSVYGSLELDAGNALDYVKAQSAASGVKVTLTHLVGKAVAEAIAACPEVNAVIRRGRVIYERDSVDVFFQVALDRGEDLSGAKVEHADRKSVVELARELAERAERIRAHRDRQLTEQRALLTKLPPLLRGAAMHAAEYLSYDLGLDLSRLGIPYDAFGSAMVTNVGMFGLPQGFAPLVPFSRAPIVVTVGAVENKPRVVGEAVQVRPVLPIGATLDHRLLDGYQAGKLMRRFREVLEDPARALPPVSTRALVSTPSPWYQRAVSDDPKRDPYAQAGVSYAAMDPGKLRAQRAAEATAGSLLPRGLREVSESRGESAYVVDLGDRYMTTVTEALGTKNLVADAVRALTGRTHYDQIAADTVATILNDLCTVGGQPVCLSAYWGAGSSAWFDDTQRMADLVDGWSAACNAAGCAWGGGETQVLTTMIDPATVVLGGSAVGLIAPKEHLLLGAHVQPGDAILLAPSTGIHANGLTLARKIASELPQGYATRVPGDAAGRGYGEVLLDPSPLYGPLVEALQRGGIALRYTAHVTGHGWRKLMRAPQALRYVLERIPAVPPIFELLTRQAGMDPEQAYGTFNMGAGFAFFVAQRDVAAAQRLAAGLGRELLHAGHVEPGDKCVVIRPLGLQFDGDSLQIRR